MRVFRPWARLALCLTLTLLSLDGCKKQNGAPAKTPPASPSLRIYVVSSVAGALEPCGCVKDMLGGVDHAASFISSNAKVQDKSLVLGAGPMFFMNPELDDKSRTQDLWKAEALAQAFSDMGMVAWAPGLNDWAAGADTLAKLARKSGAKLLAANLEGNTAGAVASRVVDVAGVKLGVVGLSAPKRVGVTPEGVKVLDAKAALEKQKQQLTKEGAQVLVLLAALQRGEALRLMEKVPGFTLLVVGKPFERGETNDGPTSPVRIGQTLVVQPPNHLQGVSVVDLFVRDGSYEFRDGAGLEAMERREALERRVSDLERRIAQWEKRGDVKGSDLAARRRDLESLRAKLAKLGPPEVPEEGSFFHYSYQEVREKLGADDKVKKRLDSYYRRVNEHNKKAFADRKPDPVPEGKSGYTGVVACGACHAEELKFWKTTGHARAYETLASQHKQFNLDCVGCHVTGYEQPGGSTVTFVEKLMDVQCETCHGPGSQHPGDPANPELIVKKPERTLCATGCHHPPHVPEDWNVDQAWKQIIGPGHGE
jgi:hypothetical protein